MPTHFPNGVTNVSAGRTFGSFDSMSPAKYTMYWNDFIKTSDLGGTGALNGATVSAVDWVCTKVDGGGDNASVVSVTDGNGGLLTVTTDNAENDGVALQAKTEIIQITTGKESWFESRLQVDDATQTDFLVGVGIKDTTPFAGWTDSIAFKCDDGSTAIRLVSETNMSGSIVSASVTAVASVTDSTMMRLGWHYDGDSKIKVFSDEVHVATLSVVSGTNLNTDEAMAPIFAVLTGEAAAQTAVIDYIAAAQEKP